MRKQSLGGSTLAIFLVAGSARAQVGDSVASVSYERYPYAAAPNNPSAQVGLQVFRVRAGYPIRFAKGTILIPGLAYELLDFQQRDGRGPHIGALHAPVASLTGIQMITPRLMILASVGAGLASDFDSRVSIDDLQFNVTGMGLYKFSDTFSLGAGVSYNRQTGTLSPVPAVALNWEITDRTRVRGFVPALLNVEYRASPWLTVGVRGTLEGNRFHLSGTKYGRDNLQLAYSTVTVGPKMTFRLADLLHLDVYASAAVWRRYEVFIDGDSVTDKYLSPVALFGARLWVGPSGWRGDRALETKKRAP
ncbi:DUF6268 family outer membrane beta-barrel protein [Pendulispora albinea]|uniref:DUF6268 family outer membrane beta-barrel protein n=1 Tax=Pendulispora albinea TaxID=2741071 RepID=A0ABZ2MAW6_9BACT